MGTRKTSDADRRAELTRRRTDKAIANALSRREFLTGLAATTGALALGGCSDRSPIVGFENLPLPNPAQSGIEHIIVLMMENRSYDHYLGWLPDADGMQGGLEFINKQGDVESTFRLAPSWQNCHLEDPDHSYNGGREQFADGTNDGFLLSGTDDNFPIGYYEQQDLSFHGAAVPVWTTFDRYFCSLLGPTYPNRFFQHAAQTDRLSNNFDVAMMPAIWDRLAAAGLTGTYYYNDLPFTALWGNRYLGLSKLYPEFLADAAAGRLPNVSFVDPKFVNSGLGTSGDDHPHADIRTGQAFINEIYEAVTSSPNWPDSVLVVNYDEWGGFFDHVPPPLAPRTELDVEIGNDGRWGFRVPTLIASPLARRGFVARREYDHTSILSMIEWRWGLPPLTVRDETTVNLAHALDFTGAKNLSAPRFPVPQGPFGMACNEGVEMRSELLGLRMLAAQYGFDLPSGV